MLISVSFTGWIGEANPYIKWIEEKTNYSWIIASADNIGSIIYEKKNITPFIHEVFPLSLICSNTKSQRFIDASIGQADLVIMTIESIAAVIGSV